MILWILARNFQLYKNLLDKPKKVEHLHLHLNVKLLNEIRMTDFVICLFCII